MSKHIIIDGYNLLGAKGHGSYGSWNGGEAARERLLQDLAAYRQRVGHPITVVFDAWKQPGGTQHLEHRAGVTVIFSKQGEQADQVMQRMIRSHSQDCVVVSSDHEILDTAHANGAMVIRSEQFLGKLRVPLHSSVARHSAKLSEKDDSDILRRPDKKGNPRKLTKAARQRLRNLKKL